MGNERAALISRSESFSRRNPRGRGRLGGNSFFKHFAEKSSDFVSRAPFFVFCVLLVLVWIPTFPFAGDFDTWQLLINTPTTVLTFLLVAILQNSQKRKSRRCSTSWTHLRTDWPT